MIEPDYDEAVAVTRDIYWVGYADREASLHCNPYLLLDEAGAVLIDPGSIPHFPIVARKVIDLVTPGEIVVLVASHQDPDVCGNLPVFEDVIGRSDLQVAAHRRTIRLIRHYGVQAEFYAVDEHDFRLELKSGRALDFIALPFLHAPGAIATYDSRTRSLFTGDLFGGVSREWKLFAGESCFAAMDAFHQAYMPGRATLRAGLKRLDGLAIDRILPQHGSIIEGGLVAQAIAHLRELPCGTDLEVG